MAKPRIFVSSTYYDLKHIRSSLESFIASVGCEPILSEKGDITYNPNDPLDGSCYRAAGKADIFVLVVGGRYGTENSADNRGQTHGFYDRYDSITRKEFDTAYNRDIRVYILIDSFVYGEYRTYSQNRDNQNIKYAYVDSVNVFKFIEHILTKPRNNPVYGFERSAQIETWLREQWAGLFQELLQSRSQQRQFSALAGQVAGLKAANETLKNYLEVLLRDATPDNSTRIIEEESRKFTESLKSERLKENPWYNHMIRYDVDDNLARRSISEPGNYDDIREFWNRHFSPNQLFHLLSDLDRFHEAQNDFNEARKLLNKPPIDFPPIDDTHERRLKEDAIRRARDRKNRQSK